MKLANIKSINRNRHRVIIRKPKLRLTSIIQQCSIVTVSRGFAQMNHCRIELEDLIPTLHALLKHRELKHRARHHSVAALDRSVMLSVVMESPNLQNDCRRNGPGSVSIMLRMPEQHQILAEHDGGTRLTSRCSTGCSGRPPEADRH